MSELTVLEDELDRMGMRMVHVVQVGAPLDQAALEMQLVPAQCRWGMYSVPWEEGKRIKRFHARVFWPCREAVDLAVVGGGELSVISEQLSVGGDPHPGLPPNASTNLGEGARAVMWMLEPGQRAREGIRDAAEAFWGMYDRWPEGVVVNPVDGGRWTVDGGEVVIEGGIAEAMGYGALRMRAEGWVPRCGVVVIG